MCISQNLFPDMDFNRLRYYVEIWLSVVINIFLPIYYLQIYKHITYDRINEILKY